MVCVEILKISNTHTHTNPLDIMNKFGKTAGYKVKTKYQLHFFSHRQAEKKVNF